MYVLELEHSFAAAHQLTHAYSKECNDNVHGHNFKVTVQIYVDELKDGMVIDFKKVKEIINRLDHKNLNTILDFEPTAENLAKFLYDEIDKEFDDEDREAHIAITIHEADKASITYQED